MTDLTTSYVGNPDIPAGTTIAEYRRSRPRRLPWWSHLHHKHETTAK